MPFVSQAQAGYFHTHKAQLEKQGVNVDEWDQATRDMHLPKHAPKSDVTQMKRPLKNG